MTTILIQLILIVPALFILVLGLWAVLRITQPIWTAMVHLLLDWWDGLMDAARRRKHRRDVKRASDWRAGQRNRE